MSSYESVILGTDMGSPLELNNAPAGPLILDEFSFPPAKKNPRWAEGRGGAVLVDEEMAFANGEATARVGVIQQSTMDLAVAKIGLLQDMLQEAERRDPAVGLPCSWTPADSTTTWTWYLLLGEVSDLPVTIDALWFSRAPTLTINMTRRPFLYRPEVTGPSATGSTPLVELTVPSIPGDVSAEGRLVVTDMATQTRRWFQWGLENRWVAEETAANAAVIPPLLVDSDTLVTSGFVGTGTTLSGSYDPNASGNNVIKGTMYSAGAAVCGTGDLKHIGTFRVHARVFVTSQAKIRLAWQDGDGPFSNNAYATTWLSNQWIDVDLGLITVEKAISGTQRWSGRIEAFATGPTAIDVSVDYLRLIPAGEGYGKARASYSYTAGVITGADDFASLTAGTALNGRVAAGGTWATSGAATDLAGKAATGTSVTRSTVSDATPRFAIFGSSTFTDVEVAADFGMANFGSGAGGSALIVRWTDASNHVALRVSSFGTIFTVASLVKVVAGVETTLASASAVGLGAVSARLVSYASGLVKGHVSGAVTLDLAATDTALATGGTLATGKVGFSDQQTASSASTRQYDNFSVATPAPEPIVIYSGRSAQIRSDGEIRENSAGTILGQMPAYRGAHFYLPPAGSAGRSTRIAGSARRQDSDTTNDDGVTDSTKLQVFYTPRYLTPR